MSLTSLVVVFSIRQFLLSILSSRLRIHTILIKSKYAPFYKKQNIKAILNSNYSIMSSSASNYLKTKKITFEY